MFTRYRYWIPAAISLAGIILIGLYYSLPGAPPPVTAPTGEPVHLYTNGSLISLDGSGLIPANMLAEAGLHLFPGDRLLAAGREISANVPLPAGTNLLQYVPGIPITLSEDGRVRVFTSSAATLGEALWQAGIKLDPADWINPSLETPLSGPINVDLRRARTFTIQQGDQSYQLRSAAQRVGEALAEAGLALQGLDYSVPAESELVPANGSIRVVRVQEQVELEQKSIPFKSSYQADPETELDQRRVIQPGETGLIVSRLRVRVEDGKEIGRVKEAEWTARQPRDQLVGYGTKVVLRTEVVDGTTITYWRKISAYATAYAPCEIYTDHCSYETASGMRLQKGVVAVIRSWYYQLKGSQVYVPGYGQGTIADIGGGVGGQNWIDLGYSDNDYVGWHSTVTVYFLAPAPANISWALP